MDCSRCARLRISVAETSLATFSSKYTLVRVKCAITLDSCGASPSFLFPSRAISSGGITSRNASALIPGRFATRSEEHTSELQSQFHLVCRLLLEKKKKK